MSAKIILNQPDSIPKPFVLCILDGWGDRNTGEDNATLLASTPTMDRLRNVYPYARLEASANNVGLPKGQMGNSEVGHMNMGAGRIVPQDLPRIDELLKSGKIKDSSPYKDFLAALKKENGVCHLLGFVSDGGVHSHINHFIKIIRIIGEENIPVILHAFLDGRDTPPSSAIEYIEKILTATSDIPNFSVGTVSGRYYAMDRDNNWERIKMAYSAIAEGDGNKSPNPLNTIQLSYADTITDEFFVPSVIGDYQGMKDGDGIFMLNFRADRARQLLTAFVKSKFDEFERPRLIRFSNCVGLTEYSKELSKNFVNIFPSKPLDNILGQIISVAGLTQLRLAETEKYAHVTFFFNGGREDLFEGEKRILIPSPKVATYDLKPEMSAYKITKELIDAIKSRQHDLVIVNYANGDMVGHTGVMKAAILAAETIDKCLNNIERALLDVGGSMLVTADHGNLEQMSDDKTAQPHTAHTLFPVPLILVNPPENVIGLKDGRLADVAPTILEILGISKPPEMTGSSLLEINEAQQDLATNAKT